MSKPWILVMWSGGIDSTGLLYYLLTQPAYNDYNIYAHHAGLGNRENRKGAESEAVMNCKKWFTRNCREFTFTRSSHNYQFMTDSFAWDTDVLAFWAGQIVRTSSNKFRYRAMGKTLTDEQTSHANLAVRAKRAVETFESQIKDIKEIPETIYPLENMTKREIWDMMPEDLRKHTWYCRTPKQDEKSNWIPCEQCITCEDVKDMFNG